MLDAIYILKVGRGKGGRRVSSHPRADAVDRIDFASPA
jgi:hypothetical protein